MKDLVSVSWLADHISRPDVIILDCSVDAEDGENSSLSYLSGYRLFEKGHIAGAQHADLVENLSHPGSSMLFEMPDPERFRSEMVRLGVTDQSTVVLYDRSFTAWAARVWWMFRWIGFDQAVILDGGLQAWTAAGHKLSDQIATPVAGMLSMKLRPEVIAVRDDVTSALSDSGTCLIDTLAPGNFDGSENNYARPGHIPGAQNIFALKIFDDTGHFRSEEELLRLHHNAGTARQITYCGAGILASATAFVLVQLGFEDVALYASSLQEWADDDANPMEI